jgi:hypothetical protein
LDTVETEELEESEESEEEEDSEEEEVGTNEESEGEEKVKEASSDSESDTDSDEEEDDAENGEEEEEDTPISKEKEADEADAHQSEKTTEEDTMEEDDPMEEDEDEDNEAADTESAHKSEKTTEEEDVVQKTTNQAPMEQDVVDATTVEGPNTPEKPEEVEGPKTPEKPEEQKAVTSPSPRKHHMHYEPVDDKVHGIRKFAYVAQTFKGKKPTRPKKGKLTGEVECDRWGDFEDYKDATGDAAGLPPGRDIKQVARYPIRLISNQWAHLAANPRCFLAADHISYYTWWSQRKTCPYDDTTCYFPLSLPAGQQSALYSWFQESTGISEEPQDIMRLMQYIWRVVHPPSYFMTVEYQFAGSDFLPGSIDKWYKQYAALFKDVSMDFNIFSKRVISVVVGDGFHWVPYFAFHMGEKVCQPISSSRSGKNRPRSFIAVADSFDHTIGSPEDLFVVFLFEVIFYLEKYVTKVVNRRDEDPYPAPDLVKMARECRQRVQQGTSMLETKDFEQHQLFYRQPDGWNCGIFSVINMTAVYAADVVYHQNWLEIRDSKDLFNKVLSPYWDVAKGGKGQKKDLLKRAHWFRYNFILLLEKEAPNKHYFVKSDKVTGNYSLSLTDGKLVTVSKVEKMLSDLEDSPKAVAAREKEEADAKEKAAAKEKEVAKEKEAATKDQDAKDKDTPEKTSKASTAPALVTQASQETTPDKTKLTIKIRQMIPQNERQREVLHEHQEKARRMIEEEDRLTSKKRQRLAWIEGGKGWEKDLENKLAIATRELSLSPGGKELLKELDSLEKVLTKPDYPNQDDEDDVRCRLSHAYPIKKGTGEKDDKDVSEIAFIKYIPTFEIDGVIYRHVYQGRKVGVDKSGKSGEILDLLNPHWCRWVFEQNFCYYVMRVGRKQWKQHHDKKKISWIPVPLGSARKGGGIVEIDHLMVESVPLKYRQFDEETCTFMGMASALHYCAAVKQMGDKHLASWLSSCANAFAKGKNARSQLDQLARVLKRQSSYFRKYELRAKESKVNEWDIVNLQSPWPTVVVLLGCDGGQSHSVTLVGDLVFDSNCTHAMRLSKETLDWCCNCETGFKRASFALRFWH